MVFILLVHALLISTSISLDINKDNCVNGNELSDKCSFNISFSKIGRQKLNCKLIITGSTNILFNNTFFDLKRQENNMCPSFTVKLVSTIKTTKVAATCGGKIDPLSKIFYNFSYLTIDFNNELDDNITVVQLYFDSIPPCEKYIFPNIHMNSNFIIIFTIIIIAIITCGLTVMLIVYVGHRKKKSQFTQKVNETEPKKVEDAKSDSQNKAQKYQPIPTNELQGVNFKPKGDLGDVSGAHSNA